jgi:transaldolase
MPALSELTVKLFADGADLRVIADMNQNPLIKGFTTNPTLMRKANITDYQSFSLEALAIVPDKPISFEVFSDDFDEMEAQANEIASWGRNVYVKIPVSNTQGEFSGPLIQRLAAAAVQLNITAIMTPAQVTRVLACLNPKVPSFVSVFAGRIADSGRDPIPFMAECVRLLKSNPKAELIWASPRELLNIIQADAIGCHIITATSDVLSKLPNIGKDLDQYSLETVQMFRQDAVKAGFNIEISKGKGKF